MAYNLPVNASPFGRIQQSYATPPDDNLVYGWCPLSKLQGAVEYSRPGQGQGYGACPSQFVDMHDVSLSCLHSTQDISGMSFGYNSSVGGQFSLQQVSAASGAKLGPAEMFSVPKNFGANGVVATVQSPVGGLAGSFASGSGVQGPMQTASYGNYDSCSAGCTSVPQGY